MNDCNCLIVGAIAIAGMLINGALAHIAIKQARRERDQ